MGHIGEGGEEQGSAGGGGNSLGGGDGVSDSGRNAELESGILPNY